jgi:hypothetical protein
MTQTVCARLLNCLRDHGPLTKPQLEQRLQLRHNGAKSGLARLKMAGFIDHTSGPCSPYYAVPGMGDYADGRCPGTSHLWSREREVMEEMAAAERIARLTRNIPKEPPSLATEHLIESQLVRGRR